MMEDAAPSPLENPEVPGGVTEIALIISLADTGLLLGKRLLLEAVFAPTDPVLVCDVQVGPLR